MRARVLGILTAVVVTSVACLLVPIGIVTLFRARRLYAAIVRRASLMILWFYGIRLRVHSKRPFPRTQTIYISNHTSTLDLFVLVAMGLPNCRFFLTGFLRKLVPFGVIAWMMGTFFTVPQDRPANARESFSARADASAHRRICVLSPEGGRITSGEIGHFNKGAFHLATNLRAQSFRSTSTFRLAWILAAATTLRQVWSTSTSCPPSTLVAGAWRT
jgi:1-acyl-sn-glycerol-3-phosphate acyltransferase